MANNNIFVRCLYCSPRKGLPVDWKTEMGNLFYLASFYFEKGWQTKHKDGMASSWDKWLSRHNHFAETGEEQGHFEIVDETQEPKPLRELP